MASSTLPPPTHPAASPSAMFHEHWQSLRWARQAQRHLTQPVDDFLQTEMQENLAERLALLQTPPTRLGWHGAVAPRSLAWPTPPTALSPTLSPAMLAGQHTPWPALLSLNLLAGVNDVPGWLVSYQQMLAKDGVLLAVTLGENSLIELRTSLLAGETATTGQAALRVHPMLSLRDAARLLQQTNYALPVADSVTISASYPHLLALLHDLRALGLTSLLASARRPLTRAMLVATQNYYEEHFRATNGRLLATFELIFLHGWHPSSGRS